MREREGRGFKERGTDADYANGIIGWAKQGRVGWIAPQNTASSEDEGSSEAT